MQALPLFKGQLPLDGLLDFSHCITKLAILFSIGQVATSARRRGPRLC
jgi:hypothetical protein